LNEIYKNLPTYIYSQKLAVKPYLTQTATVDSSVYKECLYTVVYVPSKLSSLTCVLLLLCIYICTGMYVCVVIAKRFNKSIQFFFSAQFNNRNTFCKSIQCTEQYSCSPYSISIFPHIQYLYSPCSISILPIFNIYIPLIQYPYSSYSISIFTHIQYLYIYIPHIQYPYSPYSYLYSPYSIFIFPIFNIYIPFIQYLYFPIFDI